MALAKLPVPVSWIAMLVAALVLTAGCTSGTDLTGDSDADGSDVPSDANDTVLPPTAPPVDILVLVDDSNSMDQEQVGLTQRFPELLDELVHPTDSDGDGVPDHLPVTDLRVGVVTQDTGVGGYAISTCESDPFVGDDGCMQHQPSPGVSECEAAYPSWLSFHAENEATYPLTRLAQDFTCIGFLGGRGCGIEQSLEGLRRALTKQAAPGGCNEGFLRPDSLLVLIVLSDEDDTSVDADHLDMLDQERTDLGHLNIRVFLHPEMLTPVEEFAEAFLSVRGGRTDRLVLGVIAGVPPTTPVCNRPGDELNACLALPEMQERIDPAAPTQLMPSCNWTWGVAMPPVRLVRLAQLLGNAAWVGSVCDTDYGPAIRGITSRIVERLTPP